MAYTYTYIDSQRVEVHVAAAYQNLRAAFKRAFPGIDLRVSSGTRTRAEQTQIFLSRYVTAANINGRKVYDTRVWNGVKYYRISSAGTVAQPGLSNHEESGPIGPRALDIRDTGSDAGVTRRGTTRDKWMERNAGTYGFRNAGYSFSEPWHKEFTGSLSGGTAPTGGASTSGWPARERYGEAWVKSIQEKLNRLGYNLTVDGKDGPGTQAAVRDFQGKNGLPVDGIAGPNTNAKLDAVLSGGTSGALTVDGKLGPATVKALQKVLGVNQDGAWGAGTTTALQQKLVALGQQINVDGQLGPNTVKALQTVLKVSVDGEMGAGTISALQTYLNNGGTFSPAPTTGGSLTVDGEMGPATVKALQSVLGVTVDGQLGPNTIKALQTKLGVTVDGEWGAGTTSALQKILKVTVDGQLGPNTIKALQTYLNAGGKFTESPAPTPGTDYSKNNPAKRDVSEIQKIVGANVTGVWDADTDAKIRAWQTKNNLLADGVWGNTSDGLAFPPAGSIQGIDYSFARPAPSTIALRGMKHVGRYLHDSSKGLTRAEYDNLRANGLNVWLIFERDGKELLGGFDAGVECAKLAEEQRIKLGLDTQPIYFNVDYDAPATDMPKILDALRGVASVIGIERVGLYAGYGPLKAAFDAGVIRWGFQTYAWSGGKWDTRAQLQQWSNGQWGGTVDFTRAMTAEYGQNPVNTDTNPEPETWKIEISKAEAEAAGRALDEAIGALTQLRKLLP